MTATRLISDISSNPGGKTGAEWTQEAGDSIEALWALSGGLLLSVSGTNTITGTVVVPTGFTAYGDGLRCAFISAATNTGACSINISSVGEKLLVDPDGDPLSAGAIVLDRLTEIVFVAADDHFRLVSSGGTTNVTVSGGIALQESSPTRLAVAAGPDTAATSIGAISFQCGYTTSRVFIDGNVSRVTGAGSADVDGAVIGLYVDTVLVDSFTDHCAASQHASTPFSFEYEPGDISSHSYEIRVSSTISATYPVGGNWLKCREVAPNS